MSVGLGEHTARQRISIVRKLAAACLACSLASPLAALAQATRPAAPPRPVAPLRAKPAVPPELVGRTVESVRILGNARVPSAAILNVVRTREGEKFDPATVEEDYQRIFDLRKFSNVEAKVEPTETGVIVIFTVTEQRQVKTINFKGNVHVDTSDLEEAVDIKPGEAIDRFRLALAKQAIERLYRDKNYAFAHVEVPQDPLTETGEVTFTITEGPEVTIRKIDFRGNRHFTGDRLKDQIKTSSWIFIFRPGTFDPDQVDDDVASLRRYYEGKGFFDVRVGRKLTFSPDQKELKITFLIDEGQRYSIDHLSFKGNINVPEAELRKNLKLLEGSPFDKEVQERDIREIVRSYSPFGYIYQAPQADPNPDYLHIEPKSVFRRDAGKVDVVYEVHEGKPFRMGRILVKGNYKTKDKVVLREMRVAPGQLYNSAELADATDRLKGTPYFSAVSVTPIGNDPDTRDVLVEVAEAKTAAFTIGAGVNSNGGVAGDLTYEQRNFDIANWPSSWRDTFSERAFTGAGQLFRASFQPGTEGTNASIRFSEPYLFDQPYSFTNDVYLRMRDRDDYEENRLGDRVSFGRRFGYEWSALVAFRVEGVEITDLSDSAENCPEISEFEGQNFLTSIMPQIRRDTTNHGPLPYRGTNTVVGWERYGAMGGDFDFNKFTVGWDGYITVGEDLLDRKTVLGLHLESGFINGGNAPFFEKFYGGGIGSVRGFAYRGISPRCENDDSIPIGGDFVTTGTVELNYPIAGDILRGVVFVDAGDVESDVRFGTIRSAIGTGIRLTLPVFGQAPLALDFALPMTKASEDDTQIVSFSFGIVP